jgi:uncharacterized membrane protein HdeD (DUF308 family)
MAVALVGNRWWVFVLRGILAILFGLAVFLVPGLALLTFVLLFGVYALAAGIFEIAAAFDKTETRSQPRWALLLIGIVSIAAGIITFVTPRLTALSLLYLIAAWAIVTGVLDIVAAIRLRKVIEREWLYVLSGVLSVVFGVVVMAFPGAGALTMALWIGAWSVASGVLLVALGFKLRARSRSHDRGFRELATSH